METEGHPGLDGILVRMDHEKAWSMSRKPNKFFPNSKSAISISR